MDDTKSILVVDDDENTRETLSMIFEQKGYQIETAAAGLEAIEKAQKRFFNVALLDINLPDMKGIELLAPLKEIHPDMSMIMVTAHASLETAISALNQGASFYITKPLNMDEVLATIRQVLEKQCLVLENRQLLKEIQRELTERKRAEERKKELEAQLLHAQKMESLGRMAGGIAHEFNNLLTTIMGYADMMMMNHPDQNNLEGRAAHSIYRSSVRAKELTEGLLGFARKGKYSPVSLDLNDVLVETVSLSENVFEKNVKLNYELGNPIEPINADRSQVEQVLTNLIINAKDAMPEGGAITFETKNVYVDHSNSALYPEVAQPGYYVKLSISDTGIGMNKSIKMRIFDPFFTTKGIGKGTGLGLAAVYGIIKNHNGYIRCDSTPGRGATFEIFFPAGKQEVRKEKEEIRNTSGEGTILVVDDEEWVLYLAKDMLGKMGYSVLLAINGNQAVEIYKKRSKTIDLVLLDIIMADMDGMETFQALKKMNANIKVLIFSGFSKGERIDEILESGALGFLKKPFTFNSLSVAVNNVLNSSESDINQRAVF